jgi:hypothetical protein
MAGMTRRAALLLLLAFGACAAPGPPPPDPSLLAMQEWDHGPPWGPAELPWVAPPAPPAYPYYYGGAGIGLRGSWWRGGTVSRGGIHYRRGGHYGGRRGRR